MTCIMINILFQAMSIVQARMEAAKPRPSTPTNDGRTGRHTPSMLNNSRDLDVEPPNKDEHGFFGSFFGGKQRKRGANPVLASSAVATASEPVRRNRLGSMTSRELIYVYSLLQLCLLWSKLHLQLDRRIRLVSERAWKPRS